MLKVSIKIFLQVINATKEWKIALVAELKEINSQNSIQCIYKRLALFDNFFL